MGVGIQRDGPQSPGCLQQQTHEHYLTPLWVLGITIQQAKLPEGWETSRRRHSRLSMKLHPRHDHRLDKLPVFQSGLQVGMIKAYPPSNVTDAFRTGQEQKSGENAVANSKPSGFGSSAAFAASLEPLQRPIGTAERTRRPMLESPQVFDRSTTVETLACALCLFPFTLWSTPCCVLACTHNQNPHCV